MKIEPIDIEVSNVVSDMPDVLRQAFDALEPGMQSVLADIWQKSRDPEWRAACEEKLRVDAELLLERLMKQSAIPDKYLKKQFSDLVLNAENRHAIQACKSYVAGWPSCSRGLALFGDVGIGKTQLACCIALALMDQHGVRVRYANVVHAFEMARMSFESGKGNPIPSMLFSELLILDDLGAHKPTAWTTEQILLIVEYRSSHDMPLIVTSNVKTWKALAVSLTARADGQDGGIAIARIIDRLRDALGEPIVMTGKSWRGRTRGDTP